MKSFYHFVLTYRGANDETGAFAEAVFEDSMFPKNSKSFHELSSYIEMQAHSEMSTTTFDAIWTEYAVKYSL